MINQWVRDTRSRGRGARTMEIVVALIIIHGLKTEKFIDMLSKNMCKIKIKILPPNIHASKVLQILLHGSKQNTRLNYGKFTRISMEHLFSGVPLYIQPVSISFTLQRLNDAQAFDLTVYTHETFLNILIIHTHTPAT